MSDDRQAESSRPSYKKGRQYARRLGYTDEQIASMDDEHLASLEERANAPRAAWREGIRSSGLFDLRILLAYIAVIVFVWIRFQRPPLTLLAIGVLIVLINVVTRLRERYRQP